MNTDKFSSQNDIIVLDEQCKVAFEVFKDVDKPMLLLICFGTLIVGPYISHYNLQLELHFCAMVITNSLLMSYKTLARLAKIYADTGFITTNDVQLILCY